MELKKVCINKREILVKRKLHYTNHFLNTFNLNYDHKTITITICFFQKFSMTFVTLTTTNSNIIIL